MSGIEIAGLVLGAFPLLISALEHYRDTAEVLGIFWKIRREHKLWIHDLKICKLAFERNLEALLLPLIVSDEEVQDLIDAPGGPKWKNPELETRLAERLPKSYSLYLETMDRIQDITDDIKKALGVDKPSFLLRLSAEDVRASSAGPEGQADSIRANIDFQTTRIKMSFNKTKRDKLFGQLAKCNDELRDLLDSSDRIAALRQSRHGSVAKTAQTKGLWQFWRHAEMLYNLLTRSWACECRRFHLANLLLQHRTSPAPDFRVSFIFGRPGSACQPVAASPWTYQEAKIKMLENLPALPILAKKSPSRVNFVADDDSNSAVVTKSQSTTQVASPMTITPAPSPPPPTLRPISPTPSSNSTTGSKEERRKSFRKMLGFGRKSSSASPVISLVAITGPPSPPVTGTSSLTLSSSNTSIAATIASVATPPVPTTPQLVVTGILDGAGQDKNPRVSSGSNMIDIVNLCTEIPKFLTKPSAGEGHSHPPFCLKDDHCRVSLDPVRHQSGRRQPPPAPSSETTPLRDVITLEALLRSNTPRKLERRERYLIALTLASSYMQLKSSRWIRPAWSKRDILFLARDGPASIPLDQPHISRDFWDDSRGGCTPDDEDGDSDDGFQKPLPTTAGLDRNDRSLASLGIMLLELCFGTALEEHEMRRRYSPPTSTDIAANPFLDMAAALEWYPKAEGEAGPEFTEAIEWCLKNMPGSGESDGKLDRWREELFERVVLPLQYCHDQFMVARG